MVIFEFVFYKKDGGGLVPPKELIEAIDQNSIIFDTALFYGERSLKFNVLATENQTRPFYNFLKLTYRIELRLNGDLIWVGKLEQGQPSTSNYNDGIISVSFTGFVSLLDRLVDKLWVDILSADALNDPQSIREQPSTFPSQIDGRREKDSNSLKTSIVAKTKLLTRGNVYYKLEYRANGGYEIEEIEGTFDFRSGEGLFVRGENGATIFFSVGLSETGDQQSIKRYTLPPTEVTGTLTDTYILGLGFSPLSGFNYTYGVNNEIVFIAMPAGVTNSVIAPVLISGSDSISIEGIRIFLQFTNPQTVQVSLADDDYSNIRVFDTIINVPGGPGVFYNFNRLAPVTISRGVKYRVLIYISDAPITALGYRTRGMESVVNPPDPTFVSNGYLSVGTMADISSVPTGIVTQSSRWQYVELIPEQTSEDLIDQNDNIIIESLTTRLRYNSLHPQYLAPSYNIKELIIDTVLEFLPEYSTDFSTIADDIYGGLPVDYSGVTTFESLQASDLIKKLMLLSQDEYYYIVYSYNNGGVPRLSVIKREVPTVADYAVTTKDDNATIEINSVSEIRNYVLITYTDENGTRRRLTPRTNPELTDSASVDKYDRHDYEVDLGSISEAEALEIGQGIIKNFAYPRPTGSIVVTGYIKNGRTLASKYHVSKVKAGETIQVIGFVDSNRVIDPIYIIGDCAYTASNDQAIIRLDEVNQNEAFFRNIKKPLNKLS